MITDALAIALADAAHTSGASEAELVRRALTAYLQGEQGLQRYPLVVRRILLAPVADVSEAADLCKMVVQRCTTGAAGDQVEGTWRALANLTACVRYVSEDVMTGLPVPVPGA